MLKPPGWPMTGAGQDRVEERLNDSEQRLRLAMAAADMFAWEMDFASSQIKWAGNAAEVIGCASGQLTSDPESGAFFVLEEDRARIDGEFAASMASGGENFVLDFRGSDPEGGREFWRSHGRFIRDDAGKVVRSLGITQNVTRQRGAEERLQAAAERLRTVEHAAGALIYDFNFAANRFWRGDGLTRIFGWDPGEVVPGETGWSALRHPEDAKRLNAKPYADYVGPDDHYVLEYRVRHKDGHYVWVLDSGRVFRDAHGEVVRTAGATIDITRRKSAEALRNLQANLIDLSFEPIIVWHAERGIIEWNRGAEQLYGFTRTEALGQSSQKLLHTIHPLKLPALMAVLSEFKSWTGEIEHRAKDGRRVFVESRHQLIEIDGDSFILETSHDISQRKRADTYKARMAAVANASHDALFGATLDGHIEAWNRAAERLFGYSATEAIGQPISILSEEGKRQEQIDVLTRASAGETVGPFETRLRRKDRTIVDVAVAVAPVKAPDGTVTALSIVMHDIGDRKEWEARQKMMTRELAHRVKNSFAVLQSILRATLKASPDPKDFAEAFSGRLHSLAAAQDILTATDWKFAELGALARHQLSTVALNEGERLTISGPAVYLAAERSVPLALIFNELATNAIKHGALSTPAGRIELAWNVETVSPREQVLILTWREFGGPRVMAPVRRGFGNTLIERSLAGAKVERRFEPEGLICRIELSIASAVEPDGDGTGRPA
ncbi:MAG: PAS domain S-box protein [Aestuariivirga sp.]